LKFGHGDVTDPKKERKREPVLRNPRKKERKKASLREVRRGTGTCGAPWYVRQRLYAGYSEAELQ